MNYSDLIVSTDKIRKSAKRVSRNDEICDYYQTLSRESINNERLYHQGSNVRTCYKYWDIDYYRIQSVKDIKKIQLCKDKFCVNCQNLLSQRREVKYITYLDELRKTYDIYHTVFTVPNCNGISLLNVLNTMYAKFPYIIQYMEGKRKCNGIDFKNFGFVGAIRAVEITTKQVGNEFEYHPHFHCLFLFRKGLDKKRKHINDYSFNNGKLVRYFTDIEIFLQKVWYLLYNGIRLTKEEFDNLKLGYSVTCDDSRGKYHQVFKYVLKGTFKKGQPLFPYDVFKNLYYALYRRKMIQGYGILNKFKFDDDIPSEKIDEYYQAVVSELRSIETPEDILSNLDEVLKDLDERPYIKYISRQKIIRIISEKNNEI